MEYLFGKNLHSLMVRARQQAELFGLSEALVIGSKICEGMEYAHNLSDLQHKPLNIVHRDLTPHNIFITYEGKVKILDFGVSKMVTSNSSSLYTKEGTVIGPPAYMSPEQAEGLEVDHRTDLWSLGVVLYEMLAGLRAFTGDSDQAVMYSVESYGMLYSRPSGNALESSSMAATMPCLAPRAFAPGSW